MSVDIDELMNDLTSATRDDCSSYEWGTRHCDKEIDEAKAAIRNAFYETSAKLGTLKEALAELLDYVDAGDFRSNRLDQIRINARKILEVAP